MLIFPLVVAFFSVFVESRVTFPTSEVLDNVDLQGANAEATFRCYAGCRVYSPTNNADIVIVDGAGKELQTLADLSKLTPGQHVELPESNALYKLRNKGTASPSFVFYAVEKGATNYETKVLYVNPTTPKYRVSAKTDSILTVMSATGAVRFEEFLGDYSRGLPMVYATPSDSISSTACHPVYSAVSETTLLNTAFPVYSPIATLKFTGSGSGNSVLISGEAYTTTKTGQDVSAVYVSPGYVGCNNVKDALYTSLSPITSFDSSLTVKDSDGLLVAISGDYSIANQADALSLTVNEKTETLYGSLKISEKYDATSFKIGVKWDKKNAQDRFALQIDITSKVPKPRTTTKNPVNDPTVSPTTSGAQTMSLLVSCVIFAGYFSIC